jgi:hypothetical protein
MYLVLQVCTSDLVGQTPRLTTLSKLQRFLLDCTSKIYRLAPIKLFLFPTHHYYLRCRNSNYF